MPEKEPLSGWLRCKFFSSEFQELLVLLKLASNEVFGRFLVDFSTFYYISMGYKPILAPIFEKLEAKVWTIFAHNIIRAEFEFAHWGLREK